MNRRKFLGLIGLVACAPWRALRRLAQKRTFEVVPVSEWSGTLITPSGSRVLNSKSGVYVPTTALRWDDPLNWKNGKVPEHGARVLFPVGSGGVVFLLDRSPNLASLTIEDGADITLGTAGSALEVGA